MALIAFPSVEDELAAAQPAAVSRALPATMIPIAFDGQAGWWHPAPGDTGVVICPPIGRDARCAYRPLRLFADRLAAAGYPALRFEYPGEGESCDADFATDALPLWRDGVRNAVRQTRKLGCRRIVLAGLRVGGALALELARDLEVDAVMLLAPVTGGRGWLRELKLRASMATLAFRAPDPTAFVSDDLRLSPATVESLGAWDMQAAAPATVPTLVSAQSPTVAAIAARLQAAGAPVEVQEFPGYDDLFEEPHSNLAPWAAFDAAIAWLGRTLPSRGRSMAPPHVRAMVGEGWIEEGVQFGTGLRGVLCRPQGAAQPQAVVFLSIGGDPRPGLGRFAVTAGRDLAAAGVASLRFDFAGVGDSDAADGAERSHVLETPRHEDVRTALDLLEARGFASAVLVGICAGAYHAVRAAADDERVGGLLAISTLNFVWRPGSSFAAGGRDQAGPTRVYVQGLRDPAIWARIAKGDVQVRRILRALALRKLRQLTPSADGREAGRMRQGLQAFAARGGRARYLLGMHDGAMDEMERWFGRDGRRLAAMPGASVRVIPGLDHGLSYAASRGHALAELRTFLGLRADD